MKRKIILSLCTIALCFTLIIGVSYAAFKTINTYVDNSLTVTSINVDSVLSLDDNKQEIVDTKLDIELNPGEEEKYYLHTKNNGSAIVDYRMVITITSEGFNLENVVIKFDNTNLIFNGNRATTEWQQKLQVGNTQIREVDFYVGHNATSDNTDLEFDIKIEAIHTGLIGIESTEDLNKLDENLFTQLTSSADEIELTISKNVYIDLKGLTVETLNIDGAVEFVEIVNGTVNNINVTATSATCYLTNVNVLDGDVAVDNLYIYYTSTSEVRLLSTRETQTNQLTIYAGSVTVDSTEAVNVTISDDHELSSDVNLSTSRTTVVSELTVSSAHASVVDNSGEIAKVTIEKDSNLEISNDTTTPTNEDITYISNTLGEVVYYAHEGTTYVATTTTFEELNYTLENETYILKNDTYVLNASLSFASTTLYGNSSIITADRVQTSGDTVLNYLSFEANDNSESTFLTSGDVLTLNNVSFDGYDVAISATGDLSLSYVEINATVCLSLLDVEVTMENCLLESTAIDSVGLSIINSSVYIDTTTFKDLSIVFSLDVNDIEYTNTVGFVDCGVVFLTLVSVDKIVSPSELTYHDVVVDDLNTTRYFTENTYTSIQTAINGSTTGAVIHVVSGEYSDSYNNGTAYNLYIHKSVTILGFDSPVISKNSDVLTKPVVILNAKNITFDGFVINGDNDTSSVSVWNASNGSVISNNTIYGNGFRVSSTADVTLTNNTVVDSVDSLVIDEVSSFMVVENNICDGNLVLLKTNLELESLGLFKDNVFKIAKIVATINIQDFEFFIEFEFSHEMLEGKFWDEVEQQLEGYINLEKLKLILIDLENVYNNELTFEEFFEKHVDLEYLYEVYLQEKVEELTKEYLELKEFFDSLTSEDILNLDDDLRIAYEKYLLIQTFIENGYQLEGLLNIDSNIKESYEFALKVKNGIELYLELREALKKVIDFEKLEKELLIAFINGEITFEDIYDTYETLVQKYEEYLELKDKIDGVLGGFPGFFK